MRPYSNDLRERVFGAMREGASSLEAADRFGVSDSFARKLRLRFARQGTLDPTPRTKGRTREFVAEHEQLLVELVQAQPDATNAELAKRIADKLGRLFSVQTISLVLKRLGFTRKKSRFMRASSNAKTSRGAAKSGVHRTSLRRPIGCSSLMRAASISP